MRKNTYNERISALENAVRAFRQYIGARYVPKFDDDGWNETTQYEELTVVDNGAGTSYISGKPVPAGTPLTDRNYWHIYGASSGAIINLQNQIDDMNDGTVAGSLQAQIDSNDSDISDINTEIEQIEDCAVNGIESARKVFTLTYPTTSIPADSAGTIACDNWGDIPSNYTPIGICTMLTGNAVMTFRNVDLTNNGTVSIYNHSAAADDAAPVVKIYCIDKSVLAGFFSVTP